MKLLSFNYRGLVIKQKTISLKWLLNLQQPDIFLLQETMGEEEKISQLLKDALPLYEFHAFSKRGKWGGLIELTWKTKTIKLLNIWDFNSGIGDDFYHVDLNLFFTMVNIYGPYSERQAYWNNLKLKSFLKNENLFLRGDLNFTIGNSEIWGPNARSDPLSDSSKTS